MEKDVAILMADLSGYTAMTDVHGGASAARIVRKYMELIDKSCSGDCEVVQRIGDQVVMISSTPTDLAITAQKLNGFTLEENHFLSIHAGLHFGPILFENGHLFGSTINVASRIMNLAKRGQILCSSAFVNIINDDSFSFTTVGKYKLKNVLKEVEVFELGNRNESSTFPVDPVCHMVLNPDTENFTYKWEGQIYHFCGPRCMELFKSDPPVFINKSDL